MRQYGPRYGFGQGALANLSDEEVLALRDDPAWSRLMTAEYARENEPILRAALGRPLSEGEVYLAHWLGPAGAERLIEAYEEDRLRPGTARIARQVVSERAFRANMPIFYTRDARITLEGSGKNRYFVYHGGGRLRTVQEVYEAQTAAFGDRRFVMFDRLDPTQSTLREAPVSSGFPNRGL